MKRHSLLKNTKQVSPINHLGSHVLVYSSGMFYTQKDNFCVQMRYETSFLDGDNIEV